MGQSQFLIVRFGLSYLEHSEKIKTLIAITRHNPSKVKYSISSD